MPVALRTGAFLDHLLPIAVEGSVVLEVSVPNPDKSLKYILFTARQSIVVVFSDSVYV